MVADHQGVGDQGGIGAATGMGHKGPRSFATAAAGLSSTPDAAADDRGDGQGLIPAIAAPIRSTGIGIAFCVTRGHAMKLARRTLLQCAGAAVVAPAFSRVATDYK